MGPEPPRHPLTLIKPTYVRSKDNNLTCLPHCYRPTNILNLGGKTHEATRRFREHESDADGHGQRQHGRWQQPRWRGRDSDSSDWYKVDTHWAIDSAMDKRNKGYSARTELERLLGEASR